MSTASGGPWTPVGGAPRRGAATLAVAVVLAACGSAATDDTDPVPVAQAVSVPFEQTGLSDPDASPPGAVAEGDGSSDAASSPTPTPSPSPTPTIGPTSADAAAFVRGSALADLHGVEHVVVDLDADTWPEVVATGIHDRRGVVRVAWWTADGYEVLADGVAGPGVDVSDLRAADVNADGLTELLVTVEGDGLASLAIWSVPRRGVVEPLRAVGGCHDGSHVYGVTRARLVDAGGGPPVVVADCDDSPLPVADWSEQRWRWSDGAYRVVEASVPDTGDDDRDEPDDIDDQSDIDDGADTDDTDDTDDRSDDGDGDDGTPRQGDQD